MTPSTALDVFAAAREAPDRVGLIAGPRRWTFRELAERAGRQRAALRAEGALEATRVALAAAAAPESIARVLALIAEGVPMVMQHPRSTPAERAQIVGLAQPCLQIEAGPEPPRDALAPARRDPPPPEAPLAVFFTSGTTGAPKGAVLSRGALVAAAEASAANLGWRPDDRWLLSIPVAHIGGFSILVRCLAARRAVVLAEDGGPEAFLRALERDRITLASLVPTQLSRLLAVQPSLPKGSALRAILLGGAAAPPELVAAARAGGYPICTTYGLTEACAQVATEAPGAPAPPGSVGRPLIEGSVRIRAGRIQVKSPAVMTGYLGEGRRGFTADGWLETRDLGALDEGGHLFVRGRADDLIVSGGENVDPAEVEAALTGLPGVAEAVVFGRPHPEWGAQVCAVVTPSVGFALDPGGLAVAARGALAGFKRPRAWAVLSALPRTRSGKIDRRAAVEAARRGLVDA